MKLKYFEKKDYLSIYEYSQKLSFIRLLIFFFLIVILSNFFKRLISQHIVSVSSALVNLYEILNFFLIFFSNALITSKTENLIPDPQFKITFLLYVKYL